ncbi:MAG TPA: hypothetical protein VMZ27_00805 [Candidatus Saccharimonadales bacterium]|nr:hypothetical protein [Candidatus Saccharimonadales bacterium]
MVFRRLLKHCRTGLYYDGRGGWTANDAEAMAFGSAFEAIKAARPLDYESIELVLKFPDSRFDVCHPLKTIGTLPSSLGLLISLLPLANEVAGHLKSRMH